MAAYFTRSTPRPGGYYRELHRITADFDGAAVRRNAWTFLQPEDVNSVDVYEVERLVHSRRKLVPT